MRKTGVIVISLFLMACNGSRTKVVSGLEGKPLPSFDMLLTDSMTYLNTKDIPTGKPFILFFFSPSCPYCKAQTESLKKHMEEVKDIKFYFIAPFSMDQIKDFDQRLGLFNYNNITMAQAKDTAFQKYYMIQAVPYMAVYNRRKELKEVLLGKNDISLIRNIALEP